jgi:hypothetical protein
MPTKFIVRIHPAQLEAALPNGPRSISTPDSHILASSVARGLEEV